MFQDLIEYEQLDEACAECFGFSGVTFKRDFGPWKKGDKATCLWFDLDIPGPIVREVSELGDNIKTCKFQLTAIFP